MEKLSTLIKLTPANIRKNSLKVSIKLMNASEDKDDQGIHKKIVVLTRATDGIRKAMFKIYEKQSINSKAWIWCSCPYFKYFIEVADSLRGNSDIISSNGKLPFIRNPEMVPHLCKHLFAAAKYVENASIPLNKRLRKTDRSDIFYKEKINPHKLFDNFRPSKAELRKK